MTDNQLAILYQTPQTVFTLRDLALLWNETNTDRLKSKVNYYVKNKDLISLRRGIYCKTEEYDRYECGSRIYVPAYISLHTVLLTEGVIFQYQSAITLVSYLSRSITIAGQEYVYRRLKPPILCCNHGVINKTGYSIAGKERALLDMLYLFPDFYFDNLSAIDWEYCRKIVPIYGRKRLTEFVNNR